MQNAKSAFFDFIRHVVKFADSSSLQRLTMKITVTMLPLIIASMISLSAAAQQVPTKPEQFGLSSKRLARVDAFLARLQAGANWRALSRW